MTVFDAEIESLLDQYEEGFDPTATGRILEFLPKRSSPVFHEVATELMRIDMELSWEAGREKKLSTYEELFPELATNREMRVSVAFEEFRQRNAFGKSVSLDEFAEEYRIDVSGWSTVVNAHDATRIAESFDDLAATIPTAGQRWRDFLIVREIGRGALSRVLLARQQSLSNRLVVLKFEPKSSIEAENVAKLQHSNIVSVFSVHEDQGFNVFCMPFMGERNLTAEIKDRVSSDRALEIIATIADAIQHAHDQGLLHQDIKPANILIDQDDRPQLIDFNLATDVRTRNQESVGGTVPYMAPEALRVLSDSFAPETDQRSDIYSLGIVLYQLLTGDLPFGVDSNIERSLTRRKDFNAQTLSDCSPSVQAIVCKCLEFDPKQRYQSASQLEEDIRLHLADRIPRHAKPNSTREWFTKWCRRHPRLSSASAIAGVASVILFGTCLAWLARERHIAELKGAQHYRDFQQEWHELMPRLSVDEIDIVDQEDSLKSAEQLLARFVPDKRSPRKRTKAFAKLAEADASVVEQQLPRLAILCAANHQRLSSCKRAATWNAFARELCPDSKAAALQHARLMELSGDPDFPSILERAKQLSPIDADDLQIAGVIHRRENAATALPLLRDAVDQNPRDFSKWLDLAVAQRRLGMLRKTEDSLSKCLLLRPNSPLAHYARALTRHALSRHSEAVEDYDAFLRLVSDDPIGLLNRAIAYKSMKNYPAALKDLDGAIALGHDGARPLLIRHRVRKALKDWKGARQDLEDGLKAKPRDALGWVARGLAVMREDPKQALEDFDQAIVLDPRCYPARNNAAYLLSEKLNDIEAAIDHIDELVKTNPRDATALSGRSVLLARADQLTNAERDATKVLELETATPRDFLRSASALSIASESYAKMKPAAIAFVARALMLEPSLSDLVRSDPDLAAISKTQEFKDLCDAAELMEKTATKALR